MKTKVINCYKDKDPAAVYIGRGSPWGNPYSHLPSNYTSAKYKVASREEAIEAYRQYLYKRLLKEPELRLRLLELEGKKLACFCAPLPCHGHVLVRAIEWLKSLTEISPLTDGINHINVYSKGNTVLGRLLSNFAHTPFKLNGQEFASIEGYWYWLSCKDDKLKTLHGAEAKRYGREARGADWPKDAAFKQQILFAIHAKLNHHPNIAELLVENDLPLKHYYVQNGAVVYPKEGCQWILDEFDLTKKEIRESRKRNEKIYQS